MASKILESAIFITPFGMNLSILGRPTKADFFAAQGVQAHQEPCRAESRSGHLVGYALRGFLDANSRKLFNEFFIGEVLAAKLPLENPPRSLLPLGVRDHFHT